MKKIIAAIIIAIAAIATIATANGQPVDPTYWHYKQKKSNWLFERDTVRINCLRIDNKLAIDSLGRIWWYDNSAASLGELLIGNGTYYAPVTIGTTGQVLTVGAGTAGWATPTVSGSGVTGLTDMQVLYGKADGTIDQEYDFQYDEDQNTLFITDESGLGKLTVADYDVNFTHVGSGYITVTNTGSTTSITTTGISFSNGADDVAFERAAGGGDYTLTWPNSDGDPNSYLKSDGSGGLSWQVHSGYCLQFSAAQFNPADATTYYMGINPQSAGGTAAVNRIYIPRNGTITAAYVVFDNSGTLGTTETGTIAIRLNNTTDYSISASVANDVRPTVYNNTGLSIAVSAGDYIELKWTTPTYATNPTQVRVQGVINIQ